MQEKKHEENKKMTLRWFKLQACPATVSFFILIPFSQFSRALSFALCFSNAGQTHDYRNLRTLAIARQNWVTVSTTKLWTLVYMQTRDEEVGAIWPHWETNPKNSYDMQTLPLPSFLLHMMWSTPKQRVIFFLFDGNLGKSGYLFFSLCPFSHC